VVSARDYGGPPFVHTGKLVIGSRWRDSQISAATPRTRSEVEYLGTHAEHLQSALLYAPPRLRERIIDAIWWTVGIALVAGLFWASLRVPS
jgi:hypothetical protein